MLKVLLLNFKGVNNDMDIIIFIWCINRDMVNIWIGKYMWMYWICYWIIGREGFNEEVIGS